MHAKHLRIVVWGRESAPGKQGPQMYSNGGILSNTFYGLYETRGDRMGSYSSHLVVHFFGVKKATY